MYILYGGTHFDCCSTNLSTLACMASAEGLCTSPRNVRMDFESASISLCDDLSSFDSSRNSCFPKIKKKQSYILLVYQSSVSKTSAIALKIDRSL